jgi:XTP/dITP diphosphohydrolase
MSNRPLKALVVATTNLGKLREIRKLLSPLPIEVITPKELLGVMPQIVEDGERFEDNAIIKARAIAQLTQQVTLADDSGLEVDAIFGLPGVRSARYAGEHATDADNNAALIRALTELGVKESKARFRCSMALVDSTGTVLGLHNGVCEGRVTVEPRGNTGFGYDPLFVVTELGERTMAELTDDEKNAISHRGRALRAMLSDIEKLVITERDIEVSAEL